MSTIKSLDDLDIQGCNVLVRSDLNVPIHNGKIRDNSRIVRSLPTLNTLIEKGARVIVISHFGRPKGQVVPEMSLKPVAKALENALGRNVIFGDDCIGLPAQKLSLIHISEPTRPY